MDSRDKVALATKRLVLGHVSVCQGCCCGNTRKWQASRPCRMSEEGMEGTRLVETDSTLDWRLPGTLQCAKCCHDLNIEVCSNGLFR
jgi:hypothetical protein